MLWFFYTIDHLNWLLSVLTAAWWKMSVMLDVILIFGILLTRLFFFSQPLQLNRLCGLWRSVTLGLDKQSLLAVLPRPSHPPQWPTHGPKMGLPWQTPSSTPQYRKTTLTRESVNWKCRDRTGRARPFTNVLWHTQREMERLLSRHPRHVRLLLCHILIPF